MERHRVAIIGLGMASGQHAKALRDLSSRVEVVAAFSPTRARRDAFAAAHGFPVVDDIEAIWNDATIRAVIVLTPPNSHLELVERAAACGKHVLLEKPLDITIDRSVRLVETAEAANIKLGIVLQQRFREVSVALKALIDEGWLGDLVSASARLMNWRPQDYYDQPGRGTLARDGGGVLLTQGIHTLDLLISLAGLPVEVAAFAATSQVHRMETEDLAAAAIRFDNGALGTIFATTTAYPGIPDTIEWIGTKGSARIEGARMTAAFKDGTHTSAADEGAGTGAGADPMAFPHTYHRAIIADFLSAIEEDREPRISGREALKAHRLIEALLRAAGTGARENV